MSTATESFAPVSPEVTASLEALAPTRAAPAVAPQPREGNQVLRDAQGSPLPTGDYVVNGNPVHVVSQYGSKPPAEIKQTLVGEIENAVMDVFRIEKLLPSRDPASQADKGIPEAMASLVVAMTKDSLVTGTSIAEVMLENRKLTQVLNQDRTALGQEPVSELVVLRAMDQAIALVPHAKAVGFKDYAPILEQAMKVQQTAAQDQLRAQKEEQAADAHAQQPLTVEQIAPQRSAAEAVLAARAAAQAQQGTPAM